MSNPNSCRGFIPLEMRTARCGLRLPICKRSDRWNSSHIGGSGFLMSDEERKHGLSDQPTEGMVSADAEEAWRSIQRVIDLQSRLTDAPEEVDDEEIRAAYGLKLDPSAIRQLFARSTFGRRAKDQRASARGRLRRRLRDLANVLDEVECAVDDVFAAPGRTNGRAELDRLKTEIARFRRDNKLVAGPVNEREVLPFEEMFSGQSAWPGADEETDLPPDPSPS